MSLWSTAAPTWDDVEGTWSQWGPPLSLTATVHEPDGTHLADLPRLAEWNFVDPIDGPGGGDVTVVSGDATGLQAQGNHIRFHLGGLPVFALRVDPPSRQTLVNPQQGLDRIAGRGIGAVLDSAVVDPENGLGKAPPERPFDWRSKHFVPWADVVWTTPATHGTAGAPVNEEWEQLEGWPEIALHAEWMQAGTPTGGEAPTYIYPPIYSYYQATLSLAENMDVGIFATADDELDLWVNGEHLIRTEGAGQWRRTHMPETDHHWEAGDHYIRIRAYNLPRPPSSPTVAEDGTIVPEGFYTPYAPDSAAGVLFAACRLNALGEPTEVLLTSQGSGWTAVGDPPHPPGMTPGRKFRILVGEAQDRGEIPGVTVDFNDEFATPRTGQALGEEWLDNVDSKVEHGRTVLDVLTAEAGASADWHMTPNLVLQLWGRGRRGVDLTTGDGPVRLRGADVESMDAGPPQRIVNSLLVETAEGHYARVEDADSIAKHGRFGGFVRLGEQDLPGSAEISAEQILADHADPPPTAEITLGPTCRYTPYLDFGLGDVIEVETRLGVGAWRVLAFHCSKHGDRIGWKLQVQEVPE